MNKKFLSAILFGALMVTSTGTFVSCKDYDDDIANLQTQIDKNSSAIAELQKLVGQGKWVSSISSIENGFTVNMSDGSSHQIKGINGKDGADGKNGTEWTIGEDGFWYVDGEKTENVAVAKDGKNGVTAPAPYINADGMWVVYTFDAEKGEFVAETTEISAQGTNAYAVKADGIYTLYIADENGELQEIALPATSDSFVVEAPFKDVVVYFERAEWTAWTAASKTESGKALLAKYPELAEIKKNAAMKQGGILPLMVTPAAVELTDDYSFQLQTIDGKFAEIELSSPAKGTEGLDWSGEQLISRAADDACMWSLDIEPAYNEKKKQYAGTYRSSLVVANEKGTTVRTAFAYTVSSIEINKTVDVLGNGVFSTPEQANSTAPYAEKIDLFAPIYNSDGSTTPAPIRFENEYKGHYIIVIDDALKAEKYGLSIAEDGHTLNVAKMPESELEIKFDLKVIALGLNGSVKTKTVKMTVGQEIAANTTLEDKVVTLGYDAVKNSYVQQVRWDLADYGFTATQLNQFLTADKNIAWSYTDENGDEVKSTVKVYAYKKDGKTKTTSYKDAVTFGFDIDSRYWVPQVYAIRLTAKTDDNTVVYVADATMTINNPTATAIKLVPEFVNEEGVLQVVGELKSNGKIEYNLDNGVILGNQITTVEYVDVDNFEYEESIGGYDPLEMASCKWMNGPKTLSIFPYNATKAETEPALYAQLETVRNIRATYKLFGNSANTETFDFQVVVKSAVYSATPADVVTIPAAKLGLSLVDNPATTGTDKDERVVNIAKIVKAVLAYGPKAGEEYNLWKTGVTNAANKKDAYNVYSAWNTIKGKLNNKDVKYVVNANDLLVQIALEDMKAFGYSANDILAAQQEGTKFYIMANAPQTSIFETAENNNTNKYGEIRTWAYIWNTISKLTATVEVDGAETAVPMFVKVEASKYSSNKYVGENVVKLNAAAYNAFVKEHPATSEQVICLNLWKTYCDKIAYTQAYDEYTVPANDGELSKYLTEEATIDYADETTGVKFAGLSGTTITARLMTGVDMTTETVEVPFKLTVKDVWGKTMVVPFTVTVSK